ncbi:MAG: transporter [Deferrisomatales bacterium]
MTLGLGADYASRYIWRGYDLVEDNRPAFQPSATVSLTPADALTLSFNVWASYGVSEPDSANEWDEVDYTLALDYALSDRVSLSLGHIYYHFPTARGPKRSDVNDTKEIFLGVSVGLPANLSTDLTVYYDYDNGKGIYANLGLGYSRALSEAVTVNLGANVGYMSYTEDDPETAFYTDEDGDAFKGFSDANFQLGVDVDLGHGFSLSNALVYTIPLDDAINTADREVWTLTSLSFEF